MQQKLAILRRAEQDPAGFVRDFIAAARLAPQDIGVAPATPPPPDTPPEPDVLFENGQTSYSHQRMQEVLAWREQKLRQELGQQLAPLQQRMALADIRAQADQRAQAEIAEASKWAGFSEAKDQIRDYLATNRSATLRDAYIAVVPAALEAKAQKAAEEAYQKALTDLQAKAGAASGPAPRTGGAASTRTYADYSSMHEALVAALADG